MEGSAPSEAGRWFRATVVGLLLAVLCAALLCTQQVRDLKEVVTMDQEFEIDVVNVFRATWSMPDGTTQQFETHVYRGEDLQAKSVAHRVEVLRLMGGG